jgi:hypothetical protein
VDRAITKGASSFAEETDLPKEELHNAMKMSVAV